MVITRDSIISNSNKPVVLEMLYKENKKAFSELIEQLHNENIDCFAVQFWYARLFLKKEVKEGKYLYWQYVIVICLIALSWLPVKISTLDSNIDNEIFVRIIPVTFSYALSLFFFRKGLIIKNVILTTILHLALLVYYLFLPLNTISQSITNALYFGLIIMWFFVWLSYSSYKINGIATLSEFMKITAETIIWSTLFILGGVVLVLLLTSLFSTIGINANSFILNNVVTLGLCAAPFVSLLVLERIEKIRISTILTNIFLPLFLVSILSFGIVSLFTNNKPYETRNVFITYNIMLVIVICLLVYAITNSEGNRYIKIFSNILAVCSIVLDGIVLSATIYRISAYGYTPNKVTLLVANIVMLGNLIYIIVIGCKDKEYTSYSKKILYFLPVYFVLAIIIVFIFPIVFKYK